MTFKPPYQVHMVFNTPTLQMIYHPQYQQLIKFKSDFMLFHDIFSCMLDVHLDPAHSALLLQLLVILCLRAFQKNVFRSLANCIIQQPLHSTRLENTGNDDISLTHAGISQVFQHFHFQKDIQFITGSRMKYQPELTIIKLDMIDELSLADWEAGGQSLPLDVALLSVPSNVDAWLAIEQGQHSVPTVMFPNPVVFLLAIDVHSSKLSHHLQATIAEHHVLYSFTEKESQSASQLHTNHK
ncbi:uncharacterized protein CIMG_13491 [Coccidioides immitis RS]|uniref:Uncharacterized protein n=1 Tax=Coccidioides immitis (strain RS) TaxID=246410 RepID=A0A0D8JV86_COCIM|nr:uncharacterized protein CIMG_13491 [Coccidioides immitis RS]KJF61207.1 hypothetical protein CIMG_13491 [Coccidioides immitis RS]